MNGSGRSDFPAHRPSGRLLRVCVILVLAAAWLAPPPALEGSSRRPQETGATDSAPPLSPAEPNLGYWAAGFGPVGVSGSVSDLVVGGDGSLYVVGDFAVAGDTLATRIARWDGSAWYPLGSGVGGPGNPKVLTLDFGLDGALYAAGDFNTAGGVPANSVARWDGTAWYPLGSGIENCGSFCVRSLTVGQDGSLYAGGEFDLAGGRPASSFAKWIGEAGRRTLLPLVFHSH